MYNLLKKMNLMKTLLVSALLVATSGVRLTAQTNPIPSSLLVTSINNITSTSQYIDNRSSQRSNTYHSFCATGTGTWSAVIQYSDTTPLGSYTTFSGSAATVSNSSTNCLGAAYGYHLYVRFLITGVATVNYTGEKGLYIRP